MLKNAKSKMMFQQLKSNQPNLIWEKDFGGPILILILSVYVLIYSKIAMEVGLKGIILVLLDT